MTNRQSLLARIHIAKKDLGMDDDTYRGFLRQQTGKESSRTMTDRQLLQVVQAFKDRGWKPQRKKQPARAGNRPLAAGAQAAKIRALWLNLYHLGEVTNPAEDALAAYVARMTKCNRNPDGIQALQWLDSYDANRVIKGLRGWLERVGHDFPDMDQVKLTAHYWSSPDPDDDDAAAFAEKIFLISTQWHQLVKGGHAFRHGFEDWLYKYHGVQSLNFLSMKRADRTIEDLGRWIRKVRR